MASLKKLTMRDIKRAAKQSPGLLLIPPALQEAIQSFIQDQEKQNLRQKVMKLSDDLTQLKMLSRQLQSVDEPDSYKEFLHMNERSRRWKLRSSYEEAVERYKDNETIAYVAARMPSVYSAVHRVLMEIKRRLPEFQPKRVLDFGSGPGTVLWALRELWPHSIENINQVEPSGSMSYACRNLLRGVPGLPVIHSYESIHAFSHAMSKNEREHDLVVASYVLGEIPSIKDRITLARQLWNLTQGLLVIIEPGSPEGSKTVLEVRSHILSMEKRKCRKKATSKKDATQEMDNKADISSSETCGAFVVAPCAHDGVCPMSKGGTYCHFVQRLQRTQSQIVHKRTNKSALRGFEDEKFSFIVLKRGERPKSDWPLDGMQFDELNEYHAKRKTNDISAHTDAAEDGGESEPNNSVTEDDLEENSPSEREPEGLCDDDDTNGEAKDQAVANLGSGWGRIVFSPLKRGKRVTIDVCRSISREGSEGSLERIVISKSKNPEQHFQARKSHWGDLWPF